jgi:hypothetical protein
MIGVESRYFLRINGHPQGIEDFKEWITPITFRTIAEALHLGGLKNEEIPHHSGLIIVAAYYGDSFHLWRSSVGAPVGALPIEITNKYCQGDKSNLACFWGKRFFPDALPPTDKLRFLAAHSVLTAGKLTPHVRGLEIAEGIDREGKIKKLLPPEIATLRKRSEEMDSYLLDFLGMRGA